MSTNKKIAKASLLLIIAGLLGNLLGLLKEMLVARAFGVNQGMDAFYAAITLPNLLCGILLSTFGVIFIPLYIRQRIKDPQDAENVLASVLNLIILYLFVVSGILFFTAPLIIRIGFHGFSPETAALATHLLRLLSFSIPLTATIGIAGFILNANEDFSTPSYSPMLITLATIACLLLFAPFAGVTVLVYGLLAGLVLQFVVMVMALYRRAYRYRLLIDLKHPAVKEFAALSLLFFLSMNVAELNTVVDRVMASFTGTGSVALLGYAGRLIQVPLALFAGSLTTALLPYFSLQIAENRIPEMKDTLTKSIRMSSFIFIPLTVLLAILAQPLICLLFQRGVFDSSATRLTSQVFICYSFQMLFYSLVTIFMRFFLAFQDIMTFLKISLVSVFINIVLNYVFAKLIDPPAAGIALSTSVVLLISSGLFLFAANRKMPLDWKAMFKDLPKIALASAGLGCMTFFVLTLAARYLPGVSLFAQLLRLSLASLSGLLAFVLICLAVRLEELSRIVSLFADRFRASVPVNPL